MTCTSLETLTAITLRVITLDTLTVITLKKKKFLKEPG